MAATLDKPLLQLKPRSYTPAERDAFYKRLAEIQEKVRKLVPPGVSLADELIAERRAEAAREEAKWNREY